jgi:hypothetical protein
VKQPVNRPLYWTPRILGILLAAFVSISAFDVFGQGYTVWETIAALAMHLVPTAAIIAVLAIAWRWEGVGSLLFIGLGVLYIVLAPGNHWAAYLAISGPLVLVGLLFLANWRRKARGRRATNTFGPAIAAGGRARR